MYKALYMCLKYDLFASLILKKQPFAGQAIILFLAFTQYSPNMENHWNSSQQLACTQGDKQLYETALNSHYILNPRNVWLILTRKFLGHEQSLGLSWKLPQPTLGHAHCWYQYRCLRRSQACLLWLWALPMVCTHQLAELSCPGSHLHGAVWTQVCQNMTQSVFASQRHGYCTLGEAFNRLDFSSAILDSRRFNYVVRVSQSPGLILLWCWWRFWNEHHWDNGKHWQTRGVWACK